MLIILDFKNISNIDELNRYISSKFKVKKLKDICELKYLLEDKEELITVVLTNENLLEINLGTYGQKVLDEIYLLEEINKNIKIGTIV